MMHLCRQMQDRLANDTDDTEPQLIKFTQLYCYS